MGDRSLKEQLARYMDPQAFVPVANPVKRTSPQLAQRQAEKRKVRREIVMKRAAAAIRFLIKDENFARLVHARERAQMGES